jgi:hypothetical protein
MDTNASFRRREKYFRCREDYFEQCLDQLFELINKSPTSKVYVNEAGHQFFVIHATVICARAKIDAAARLANRGRATKSKE